MKYYSTNHIAPDATLEQAVVNGLAPDRGLYMPRQIKKLPADFFESMGKKQFSSPVKEFQEMACKVAEAFFGEDVEASALRQIVCDTLQFDCPLVEVEPNIYALELFHGPTLAFKDVGARFMARLLQYFLHAKDCAEDVNVLVATSGDTGSAVANGFLGVEGIRVFVLYPKGKVSAIQEAQFATLGRNITAIEVDGAFDDCQALVKSAFMDADLQQAMRLTSANSINVARFLPQSFYYFWAYAQLKRKGREKEMVVSVPSGNFGNICAALFAHAMGLPVKRFIAANNANDTFCRFLQSGQYEPQSSVATLANAMDVGDPSNFARIFDLYGESHARIAALISGVSYSDNEIRETISQCFQQTGYVLDPHGACGYHALKEQLRPGETGVFCETAHPAKFLNTVEGILGQPIALPDRLAAFLQGQKRSISMPADFPSFKRFLLSQSGI